MAEKIKLTISQLLQDLKDGLTRDEIGVKYGLNKAQVKVVFRNPKLKFKKTIRAKDYAFELIDDAPDAPIDNQFSMDLSSAEPTLAEETAVEAAEIAQEVDAFTQQGVELTDDIAEAGTGEVPPVPPVTATSGVW